MLSAKGEKRNRNLYVHGDESLFCTQVSKWVKNFDKDRENIDANPKSTVITQENVEKVARIV